MIKKLFLLLIFFLIGFATAVSADTFFRHTIQDLYQWTTNNAIQFGGKAFYLFGNPLYFISFGIAFVVFSIANEKKAFLKIFLNILFLISIFSISLIVICGRDANLFVHLCSDCSNGIKRLGYDEINYGLNLSAATVISIIPSLIKIVLETRKASAQQRI